MAFLEVNFYSQTLGMQQVMNVILPEWSDHNPDWTPETLHDIPILYLLHGMAGNHNDWMRKTNLERLVRQTKIAVVMPAADLSWYTNTAYGAQYFTFFADELPRKVQELFPQLTTKSEQTFVAGVSMGGYGAFKLALASNHFGWAASLGGALNPRNHLGEGTAFYRQVFPTTIASDSSIDDLRQLVRQRTNPFPQLYAWVGEQDPLFVEHEQMISELQALGANIDAHHSSGAHEWYDWNVQIEQALAWLPIQYQPEKRLQ